MHILFPLFVITFHSVKCESHGVWCLFNDHDAGTISFQFSVNNEVSKGKVQFCLIFKQRAGISCEFKNF